MACRGPGTPPLFIERVARKVLNHNGEVAMPIRRNETGNRLLDRLPNDEYERLVPLLEHVTLAAQQHLYDVDAPIPHVYFPKTGMVSLVTLLKDGRQVESGTIGNEGLVGVSVLLGLDRSTPGSCAR